MKDNIESSRIKSKTYTKNTNIEYRKSNPDSAGSISHSGASWAYTKSVQAVATNKTSGEIKLRIAPREMPESTKSKSTK
jgi:hypothetical protein